MVSKPVDPPPPVTLGRLLLRAEAGAPPFDPAAVQERELRRRQRAEYIATVYAPSIRPRWTEEGAAEPAPLTPPTQTEIPYRPLVAE